MRIRRSTGCIIAGCVVLPVVLVALNLEQVTEFSPDDLMFRGALYVGGVRVLVQGTWSTPLLDEAREKNPIGERDGPIRWSYVHGNNVIGRLSFANGDAKPAYRLFWAGRWDDVLSSPNNDRDEIITKCVSLMRELKYDEMVEFLYEIR
jgi:hypothetical protein